MTQSARRWRDGGEGGGSTRIRAPYPVTKAAPGLSAISSSFKSPPLPLETANMGLFRLSLTGDRAGQWSVRASGNWRVVFRFENGEAVDVDLIDYH